MQEKKNIVIIGNSEVNKLPFMVNHFPRNRLHDYY